MRVKICGNRTADDIRVAVESGADAIGLIVGTRYLSEDQLAPDVAAVLLAQVPVFVLPVLVTHLQTCSDILAIHRRVPTPVIQLHDTVAAGEIAGLRQALPGIRLVAAVHVASRAALDTARQEAARVEALLLDSRTDERIGGTGQVHDWSISADIVEAVDKPVILAGGLTPENVAAAIAAVRPYAVDVNSGVDDRQGNKDRDKVRRFINQARAAGTDAPAGDVAGALTPVQNALA